MKLKSFLIEKNIKPSDFCIVIGVSVRYLYHLMQGRYKPGYHLLVRIEKHTQGKVRASDFNTALRKNTGMKSRKKKNKPIQLDLYKATL